jgi:hypothetical protein
VGTAVEPKEGDVDGPEETGSSESIADWSAGPDMGTEVGATGAGVTGDGSFADGAPPAAGLAGDSIRPGGQFGPDGITPAGVDGTGARRGSFSGSGSVAFSLSRSRGLGG